MNRKDTSDIKIRKKSWNDISINEYYQILDIQESDLEPWQKNAETLAVLCDCDPERIYTLPLMRVNELTQSIDWLNGFKFNRKFNSRTIRIGEEVYNVETDISKMSISQYMDFQNFWRKDDLREYYGNILACFLVPKGKSYCEGYDVGELANEFRDKISIALANAVCFFFLRKLYYLIKASRIYLTLELRRMEKKTPELKAEIEKVRERLRMVNSNFGFSL